ncbi:MAG: hypothetical protein KGI08_09335 [Thaumarchaeota archaeon]|nr:hypothetical protein [Nitrososphaerota archaeon]
MNRKELIEQLLNGDMEDNIFCLTIDENGDKQFFAVEGIARACDSRPYGSCSYSPTILIEKTKNIW